MATRLARIAPSERRLSILASWHYRSRPCSKGRARPQHTTVVITKHGKYNALSGHARHDA
eukprot:475986-Pleurochrysis_carterae.AAC.3